MFDETLLPSIVETEQRKSKLFSLIYKGWMIFFVLGILFDFIGYYYIIRGQNYMQKMYLVSALFEYSSALFYSIISTMCWLVISLIIGIPFLFGKNMNKLMKICGLFFIISAIFEALTIWKFLVLRNMMQELAMTIPILTDEEVLSKINAIYAAQQHAILFQQGDIATVGLGYLFWGRGVNADVNNLQRKLGITDSAMGYPAAYSTLAQAIRTIKSGANLLSLAGILYFLLAFFPMSFLSFLSFILLILGFSRISGGWNTLSKAIGGELEGKTFIQISPGEAEES